MLIVNSMKYLIFIILSFSFIFLNCIYSQEVTVPIDIQVELLPKSYLLINHMILIILIQK